MRVKKQDFIRGKPVSELNFRINLTETNLFLKMCFQSESELESKDEKLCNLCLKACDVFVFYASTPGLSLYIII